MIDANEAWSPKEAVRRANAFAAAVLAVYWLEDPCPRHDVGGLKFVRESLPTTRLETAKLLISHTSGASGAGMP